MAKKTDRKRSDNLINMDAVAFQIRESYKAARTNIVYSIIKKGCKKISFTSANKGEGKTVTSVNVAIALAQQVNTRVLIIDCDLRRPQIHNALSLEPSPGLTIRTTKISNLFAVTYGAVPPNPSELLSSSGMQEFVKTVEKDYDYIIFDTPPVGVVVDSLPLVKQSDGVVLVVKHNSTTYPALKKVIDVLNRNGGKILGIIVNNVESVKTKKFGKGGKGYGYEYGYGYGYY